VLDGGVGHDTLVGSCLADRLRGGVGLDTLQGGAGADMFDYTNLKEALWSGDSRFERITDFVIGVDRLDVETIPAALNSLGLASALSTTGIGNLLNASAFSANDVATFTAISGGRLRTFLALNDGTPGFGKSMDVLVEMTGFSYAPRFTALSQITLA
jgi:Ca2+-binding RTX toxin-like protein